MAQPPTPPTPPPSNRPPTGDRGEGNENKVVDVLRAQGQLIRNTGTNSIKSINVRLDNFTGVFNAIETNLAEQSTLLADAFELQLEQAEDAARQRELDPPEPSDSDDDGDGSSNDPKRSFKEMLKDTFKPSKLLLAAGIAAVAPYLAGALTGLLDGITGGSFSTMLEDAKTKIPDLFENLKTTVALVYGNFEDFFESGDISDLLKDKDGNPIIDIEALKEKATTYGTIALSAVLLGPLGAIGTAVALGITNAFEETTGIDVPQSAEVAIAGAVGLFAANTEGRRMIFNAFRSILRHPMAMLAVAVAAAATYAYDEFERENQEIQAKMKSIQQQQKAALDAGDVETAINLGKELTDLKGNNPLKDQFPGGVTESEEAIAAQIIAESGAAMLKVLSDMDNKQKSDMPNYQQELIRNLNQAFVDAGIDREGDLPDNIKARINEPLINMLLDNVYKTSEYADMMGRNDMRDVMAVLRDEESTAEERRKASDDFIKLLLRRFTDSVNINEAERIVREFDSNPELQKKLDRKIMKHMETIEEKGLDHFKNKYNRNFFPEGLDPKKDPARLRGPMPGYMNPYGAGTPGFQDNSVSSVDNSQKTVIENNIIDGSTAQRALYSTGHMA